MPTSNNFTEILLSNGIPVLLHPADGEVASIYWWNQVGSADETEKEAGFAHFLEHMLFKDASAKETGKASTGRMAHAIESLGGDINAYTSFDQTVYHVTCAAQHFEKVFDVFSEMARPQSFLKSDFTREREVILEELRKNEDSPGRMLFQSLLGALYRKHPYGRPVIGFVKTLNEARVQSLEAFYRRHYVSSRMGVVVVAPMKSEADQKKLVAKLEKKFGRSVIRPEKRDRSSRTFEPVIRKEAEIALTEFNVQTPSLMLAFRVPELKHEDVPALDLLAGILGSGELSRLYQKLFYGKQIVTEVSCGVYVPNDPGLIYVSAEPSSVDKVNDVLSEILTVLRSLHSDAPTEAEVNRVIVSAESEKLYAVQTTDGIASRLGFMKFVLKDMNFDAEYLRALRAVTSEKLKEVADRYFVPERMALAMMVPKGTRSEIDLKAIRSLIRERLPSGGEVRKPSQKKAPLSPSLVPEVFTTPNGIQVAYLHRPSSHAFSIQSYSLGGLRLEKNWGASHLMAQTMAKGTSRLSANQISEIVEGRASSLDAFAGKNSVGLQQMGLARDFRELSELFSEVLLDANYRDSELAHSKRITEDQIRSIEDHSAQVATKLFLKELFDRHPYGKLSTGSLESIAQVDSQALIDQHRAWIRPKNLFVSLAGNVSEPEMRRFVDSLDASFASGGAPSLSSVDDPSLKLNPIAAPRWVEKSFNREQIHIIVGGLGTTLMAEDRHAIRLLQSLLGGQSGPLFIELREKKSLAYTVSPIHFEGIERGYVGTYIACSPSKREEAIQGLKRVIESIAKKGPNESALKRAKEFTLGRRAMDMQSDSSLASHFGLALLYGFDPRKEEQMLKRMQKVSSQEIRRVMDRYLVQPHLVTAVAG